MTGDEYLSFYERFVDITAQAAKKHGHKLTTFPQPPPPDWFEVSSAPLAHDKPIATLRGATILFDEGDEFDLRDAGLLYIVQALSEVNGLTLDELRDKSGVGDPVKMIKRAHEIEPRLKRVIVRPGRNRKGGYRLVVRKESADA